MALIPVHWWTKEVHSFKISQNKFKKQPWANGVVLLLCVAVAMLLANLPFTKGAYHSFLHTEFTMHIASPDGVVDWFFPRGMTMEKFINDILMVIFFFTVGLEIKREIVCGELSSFKKAILPVIAAFGGVAVPALIFTIVNHGTEAASGWGIPTATDIAFAVGILSILGDKVPVSLKVFLTALAIADDLIAILVVALFYGGSINMPLLAIALVVILFVALMKKLGETRNKAKFHRRARILWEGLTEAESVHTNESFPNGPERHHLRRLSSLTKKTIPPSYRLEHKLNPIVNFAIMPIFALANAGVEITDVSYFNVFKAIDPVLGSVGLGIFLGLLLGKPIGITLASWLAIRFKVGAMPAKATWPMLFAVACLGGIGFTMSIFVDTLSFAGPDIAPEVTQHLRDAGKIAVLLGSLCSGILGSLLISIVAKIQKKK